MSPEQAYLAMFAFLERQYLLAPTDDLGALLGSMSLLPDGGPADTALAADWREAVAAALSQQVDAQLRIDPT